GVMSMILSLAAGLQRQVVDTVTADTQLQAVEIHGPLPGGQARPLDADALQTLTGMANVQLAWGETLVGGTLGPDGAKNPVPAAVVGLPPQSSHSPRADILVAGHLPDSDTKSQVVLTADQARKFGWSPTDAVGKTVRFTGQYQGPPGAG